MKTISEVIRSANLGDSVTDGIRKWKVTETNESGGECVVAQPVKTWNEKKHGSKFELWDAAESKLSIIPNLKLVKSKK